MTEDEFIKQLKAECEHNIPVLQKMITRCQQSGELFSWGIAEGQLRYDKDLLEKIEQIDNFSEKNP